jgi:glycosyltransferase involved in cell wall biosynthesis
MVVHAYYPLGETRVEREAKALLERGAEVDVICLKDSGDAAMAVVDGIEVHRLPVRRHRGSSLVIQLLEYLTFFTLTFACLIRLHRRKRYNVIQVHNLPDFLVFVALIPKLMGAKIILDLHDLMPEFYAERYQHSMNSLLVRIICWQEWLSCRFADHVITVTELWRQVLIGRGQPARKVSVVMNVADSQIFYPGAAAPVSDNCSFRLIYHGMLGYRHGIDLAIRALHKVLRYAPNISLTLHGLGEYRPDLERLIEELDLQEHVRFSTDWVPTTGLPELIKSAHLAIVPYRNGLFTGGILPTKLMEYAALGMPVIAARTPGIAPYFDETTVQFFTPGSVDELASCILTLYRDRRCLEELGRNIVKFDDCYNWAQVSAGYAALVKRLRTA